MAGVSSLYMKSDYIISSYTYCWGITVRFHNYSQWKSYFLLQSVSTGDSFSCNSHEWSVWVKLFEWLGLLSWLTLHSNRLLLLVVWLLQCWLLSWLCLICISIVLSASSNLSLHILVCWLVVVCIGISLLLLLLSSCIWIALVVLLLFIPSVCLLLLIVVILCLSLVIIVLLLCRLSLSLLERVGHRLSAWSWCLLVIVLWVTLGCRVWRYEIFPIHL